MSTAKLIAEGWEKVLAAEEDLFLRRNPAVAVVAYRAAGVVEIILGNGLRIDTIASLVADTQSSRNPAVFYQSLFVPGEPGLAFCSCPGWANGGSCRHVSELMAAA